MGRTMNIRILCMTLFMMCSNFSHPKLTLSHDDQKTPHGKEFWITVLIHGSFSLRPHLTIKNIVKMLNDTIEESIYYRSTEINRRDPFFYKNQAMAGLGMHKIDFHHPHNTAAAPIIAASFEEISKHIGNNPSDEYYTFGWSGLVSNKLRYLESAFLHQDLERLIKKLKDEGHEPKVRLIGYSHGGNLALQLGALHTTKPISSQFHVDELWLIGTPIQVETDYLINSPIFKRIFNFYSRADRLQTLDFFSFKRFFSRKKFSPRHNFKLPDKLTQIRIKITGYEPKSSNVPFDISACNNPQFLKKHFKEINFDPGHFELWFMGWTILTYRNIFPLYPLPTLTFLPIITKYIEEESEKGKIPHDIVAHIKPDCNTVEIKPYHTVKSRYKKIFTFMDQDLLKHMKLHAAKFMPDDYNIKMYNQKVYGAMNIAKHEWQEIRNLIRLEKKKKQQLPQNINLHEHDQAFKGHLPAA